MRPVLQRTVQQNASEPLPASTFSASTAAFPASLAMVGGRTAGRPTKLMRRVAVGVQMVSHSKDKALMLLESWLHRNQDMKLPGNVSHYFAPLSLLRATRRQEAYMFIIAIVHPSQAFQGRISDRISTTRSDQDTLHDSDDNRVNAAPLRTQISQL
ncbi:hypothetical protein HYFRA_00011607 [Hymenoscyphus fraxineus]|uniref:Uncharacterized protein n=1 Tax=Hymenoscyphus fraxineus TaxID=746836 RepID=A0A9N9PXD8_9HELO|nr:hypothetical protein HYFRA_00011607 [Hymenoscyphus fraxineus]